MSVECEKCGADISAEWEEHPNCSTVVSLRSRIEELEGRLQVRYDSVEGIPTGMGEDEIDRLNQRTAELEENLEIAMDERNGLCDSVMQKNNELSRLRAAVEWAFIMFGRIGYQSFADELRRRAGLKPDLDK